jgi:hypothetical protein
VALGSLGASILAASRPMIDEHVETSRAPGALGLLEFLDRS